MNNSRLVLAIVGLVAVPLSPNLGRAQNRAPHDIDPTADIHPSVILEGKVTVGAYTKIDAGTVITGNVTIGHHSLIRCNVTIRGTNTIGNYVHIYDNVCIEGGRPAKIGSSTAEVPDKSIIGDHCWINHGATMHGTQMADRSPGAGRRSVETTTRVVQPASSRVRRRCDVFSIARFSIW